MFVCFISPLTRTARRTAQWRSSMVASTLINLAWNCWVFDEHFELPQKTLSSLLTYRLRPFYRKAQLLSLSLPPPHLKLRAERGHRIVFTSGGARHFEVQHSLSTLSMATSGLNSARLGGLARTEPRATPGPRPAIAIAIHRPHPLP